MSEIMHSETSKVLKPETLVFAARITKAEKTGDDDGVYRTWKVSDVKAWQGALPAVHTLTWKAMHPIMRDKSGKIVGHYSATVSSSGEEVNASEGETWIFFANGAAKDGSLEVFRAEPIAQEKKVRALISARAK